MTTPDGTTPPKAVLAAAVQDALDAIGCELTTSDCRVAAAAVVAALRLPERDRETAAKALKEAADEIVREFVCCDAYDGSGRYQRNHAICYWSGASEALIRARASALRERRES